ncbi:MAG: uroporphyrinogen-III synthase [Methanosarcinales archaeon]|nr:uroporphyrinogen-III synthase [ANME-2 cluster archaeon]MDW7776048.1 uroporphyrinogen-III synthase [Methanosarcinales archaeon]
MKIAVTRLEEKSKGTIELFARYGHEAILVPTMKTAPALDSGPLNTLCAKVAAGEVHFLIFSSTMGVRYFFDQCKMVPDGIVMIAVGPKTADAVCEKGFACETIPSYSSDHFASHLGSRIKGKTVGLVRPDVPNPQLVESLTSLDAQVVEGIAYRLLPCGHEFKDILPDVDAVIYTSGKSFLLSGVSNEELEGKIVVAIGPKCAAVMKQKGINPDIIGNGTLEGCLTALTAHSR